MSLLAMARNGLKPPGSTVKKEELNHYLGIYIENNIYVNVENNK